MDLSKSMKMWRSREAGGCAISIETQAYCTQNCPECPRTLDPTHSRFNPDGSPIRTQMPTSKVLDLIDQASDMGWKGAIHFSHYSEPLADPRFMKFSRYALSKGMTPELYTNGELLTEELVKQIDGVIPYVVLSFRTPGSQRFWETVFKKSKVRITKSYQVLIWNPQKKLLSESIARVIDKPCVGQLFTAFRINYDGQMSMCYADFNNEFGLLNAFDHSLEELWFGKEHRAAVKEMSATGSRRKRALCSICPEVYPDKGSYVKVEREDTPPVDWLRRLGLYEH